MADDDLEPIDLEPVDLEPGDEGWEFERARGPNRTRLWIALVVVGLAAWAAIALTTRGGRAKPSTTPSTLASTIPPRVDRVTQLAPYLTLALRDFWPGRLAAVIDDRLYVIDSGSPQGSLIPLPEGHAVIQDQSGASLLVSTFQETLVSTRPIGTRTLDVRDVAIRGVTPEHWWLLRNDGTIRRDGTGRSRSVPDGLRVVGAVRAGYVALDAPHSRWVVWSGSTMTRIAPASYQLIATAPHAIAFLYGCGYGGCSVEIHDLARSSITRFFLPKIPDFATFSPDGRRLAVASTLGDVYLIDPSAGSVLLQMRGRVSDSPSLPFTWTPDSRALLVVQDKSVTVLSAANGSTTRVVYATDGLEQLAIVP